MFGNSRQAWYERHKSQAEQQLQEVFILSQVKLIRQEHPRMGAEKLLELLTDILQAHNIKCGRDKFYALLKEHGLLVRHRKRSSRTTNSNHSYRKYPNIVGNMTLTASSQLWVSDITYLRTQTGFVYLSLITDSYSKKIVGWSLWPNLSSQGALNALKMAINNEKITKELIHHSDRGVQYCCTDYVNYLKGSNIQISMTENGDPYENAVAERVNGILKGEYELDKVFSDYNQALDYVELAVYKYNEKRPHASCDYKVPSQAHNCEGVLKKRWKKKVKAVDNNDFEKQN